LLNSYWFIMPASWKSRIVGSLMTPVQWLLETGCAATVWECVSVWYAFSGFRECSVLSLPLSTSCDCTCRLPYSRCCARYSCQGSRCSCEELMFPRLHISADVVVKNHRNVTIADMKASQLHRTMFMFTAKRSWNFHANQQPTTINHYDERQRGAKTAWWPYA